MVKQVQATTSGSTPSGQIGDAGRFVYEIIQEDQGGMLGPLQDILTLLISVCILAMTIIAVVVSVQSYRQSQGFETSINSLKSRIEEVNKNSQEVDFLASTLSQVILGIQKEMTHYHILLGVLASDDGRYNKEVILKKISEHRDRNAKFFFELQLLLPDEEERLSAARSLVETYGDRDTWEFLKKLEDSKIFSNSQSLRSYMDALWAKLNRTDT